MSAAEEQRKRLEALKKKKEEVRLKQQGIANRYNDVIGGLPTGTSAAAGDLSQTETSKPIVPKQTGPSIEFKNFVGVYSIAPKQKPYMYDQGIQVNKNDIDLTLELQQEENLAGFVPSKEDEKKDDDDENFDERKKEKKVHQFSEDEVEKLFAKPNFKRFIRKGSDILEQQLSDTEPLIDDLIDRNDDAVQGN